MLVYRIEGASAAFGLQRDSCSILVGLKKEFDRIWYRVFQGLCTFIVSFIVLVVFNAFKTGTLWICKILCAWTTRVGVWGSESSVLWEGASECEFSALGSAGEFSCLEEDR